MTAANFLPSLKRVLVHEGGWSNHPRDPGGVTLNGIIQRVYDADRKRRSLPTRPLTPKMAKEPEFLRERDALYRSQYWNAVRADELPAGVDYCIFDGAVNSGPVQSTKWLQRALQAAMLYSGSIDGHLGGGTLMAVETHPNHDALIAAVCQLRMAFLRRLRTWDAFGVGWSRRVNDVLAGGQAWATGENAPKPTPIPAEEMAKADPEDVKVTETPEGKAKTDTVTAVTGGGIGDTLLRYFDQASGYLSQLAGLPDWLARYVVIGVIVLAFGLAAWAAARTLYGIYRSWRGKREVEVERAEASEIVRLDRAAPRRQIPRRAVKRTKAAARRAKVRRRASL